MQRGGGGELGDPGTQLRWGGLGLGSGPVSWLGSKPSSGSRGVGCWEGQGDVGSSSTNPCPGGSEVEVEGAGLRAGLCHLSVGCSVPTSSRKAPALQISH